ncbi:MAG TPA: dihydrofolate reductase [Gammaproteobacteria bacterium]|nr:dihydrofolate reductase [Gammaproteobacteria bacterium]
MKISLIAAFDAGRVIGNKGSIPWSINEDLEHFRKITDGSAIIMGRKTYESIGRPLPNRLNIVLTRNPKGFNGVREVTNKESALEIASNFSKEVFIIGGENIYKEFFPLATTMYLTKVKLKVKGDAFFPEWDKREWDEISRRNSRDPSQKIEYSFLEYRKKMT